MSMISLYDYIKEKNENRGNGNYRFQITQDSSIPIFTELGIYRDDDIVYRDEKVYLVEEDLHSTLLPNGIYSLEEIKKHLQTKKIYNDDVRGNGHASYDIMDYNTDKIKLFELVIPKPWRHLGLSKLLVEDVLKAAKLLERPAVVGDAVPINRPTIFPIDSTTEEEIKKFCKENHIDMQQEHKCLYYIYKRLGFNIVKNDCPMSKFKIHQKAYGGQISEDDKIFLGEKTILNDENILIK